MKGSSREVERRRPGDQLVEQRAERVDVGARVEIRAHRGLLGTHRLGRADELAEPREERAAIDARGSMARATPKSITFGTGRLLRGRDEHVRRP